MKKSVSIQMTSGVFAATLALTGCGGGGSSGDGAAPVDVPFAMRAAQLNLQTTAISRAVTATLSNGTVVTLEISRQPGSASAFPKNGVSGSTVVATARLKVLDQESSDVFTAWFNAADATLIGSFIDDGTCSVSTRTTALPVTAHVGDRVEADQSTIYASCSAGASVYGSSTTTWSLEADAGRTFLCSSVVERDVVDGGAVSASGSECNEISALGALGAAMRYTMIIPGSQNVVFKNY